MKKYLTTLAMLTVFATPAFAQSFDPDTGTGNSLTYQLLLKTRKLQAGGEGCTLSPWFRARARLSIRKILKSRAVAVSAIMKCSVASEPRAGYGSPSFLCLF